VVAAASAVGVIMTSKIGLRPPRTPVQIAARLLADLGRLLVKDRFGIYEPTKLDDRDSIVLRDALIEYIFYRLNPDEQRRIGEPEGLFKPVPPSETEMKARALFIAATNVPGARLFNEGEDGFVTPEYPPCLKQYEIAIDDFLWVECHDAALIRNYLDLRPGMANEYAMRLVQKAA
jgi:hypothetical protein